MHKAKQEIRKKREVIIVEDQLDVILSHKAGFTNTVATQGVAFTPKHINTLAKYDPHIILVFDSDKPGVNAASKAATLINTVRTILRGGNNNRSRSNTQTPKNETLACTTEIKTEDSRDHKHSIEREK